MNKKIIIYVFILFYSFLAKAQINEDTSTGKVTIGSSTISPIATLDVRGESDISANRIGWQTWDNFKFGNVTSLSIAHYGISRFYEPYGTLEEAPKMAVSGYYGLKFFTRGTERMNIDAVGNVGIGTTTTGSHKLAVEGSIGAREIKVEASGWSDFVFEKDYELPTLKEVENHIQEKGHLENIPSAEEVAENGFYLGKMDAKLLQKIEELTLYTIEQEKELETQREENKTIKEQLLALSKRLKKLESK